MNCDNCGKKGAKTKQVTRSYGKADKLFLIENIPMVQCPHCGETYFTAETLHEMERIKLHHQNLPVRRSAPVTAFA